MVGALQERKAIKKLFNSWLNAVSLQIIEIWQSYTLFNEWKQPTVMLVYVAQTLSLSKEIGF